MTLEIELSEEMKEATQSYAVEKAQAHEVAIRQTAAIETVGNALQSIATFLRDGELASLLRSTAIAGSANSLLQGLTTHDGRNGLDARTISQNAIEIAELVLKVHEKFQERLREPPRDPEIKDADTDYQKWKEK